MSRMAMEEEEQIPEEQKTVFDWCKEGNIARMAALVSEQNVNEKDSQVYTTSFYRLLAVLI